MNLFLFFGGIDERTVFLISTTEIYDFEPDLNSDYDLSLYSRLYTPKNRASPKSGPAMSRRLRVQSDAADSVDAADNQT